MKPSSTRYVSWVVQALLVIAALYVVTLMYASGQPLLGTAALAVCALAAYVFASKKTYAGRYLFPGLIGIGLFVVLPLVYTIWIGFTNYSSSNILTFERATATLLSRTYRVNDESYLFTLHREGAQLRLVLRPEIIEEQGSIFDEEPADGGGDDETEPPDDAGGDGAGDDAGVAPVDGDAGVAPVDGDAGVAPVDGDAGVAPVDGDGDAAGEVAVPEEPEVAAAPEAYISPPFTLGDAAGQDAPLLMEPLADSVTLGPELEVREIIARQASVDRLAVKLPNGHRLVNAGLRAFAAEYPRYVQGADGSLTDQQPRLPPAQDPDASDASDASDAEPLPKLVYHPNPKTGFYETADGVRITPGFRVYVAGANFSRIFTQSSFRGPFFQIFRWTVTFAALSVFFTLLVGALLAELFSWEALRFRGLYRVLLFIPYAVPSFISIQVFKGLFNQNFGEINLILSMFNVSPEWFTDPLLAKVTILIVNTWLGYPYMMLLCMGLRQSIPKDLYEATALAGAGPFTNYFKITWPLIRRPLLPLLIASFAFNFNNFVLISLLTGGRPDILGAEGPAGTNDILVSYTYRIAFEDSGKNYALAAAISTVIFFLVAALALINLRLTKVNRGEPQ